MNTTTVSNSITLAQAVDNYREKCIQNNLDFFKITQGEDCILVLTHNAKVWVDLHREFQGYKVTMVVKNKNYKE